MVAISIGNMESGKRRMLNSAKDTNAFSASRTLSLDDSTYTANVVSDTCKYTKLTIIIFRYLVVIETSRIMPLFYFVRRGCNMDDYSNTQKNPA